MLALVSGRCKARTDEPARGGRYDEDHSASGPGGAVSYRGINGQRVDASGCARDQGSYDRPTRPIVRTSSANRRLYPVAKPRHDTHIRRKRSRAKAGDCTSRVRRIPTSRTAGGKTRPTRKAQAGVSRLLKNMGGRTRAFSVSLPLNLRGYRFSR